MQLVLAALELSMLEWMKSSQCSPHDNSPVLLVLAFLVFHDWTRIQIASSPNV